MAPLTGPWAQALRDCPAPSYLTLQTGVRGGYKSCGHLPSRETKPRGMESPTRGSIHSRAVQTLILLESTDEGS